VFLEKFPLDLVIDLDTFEAEPGGDSDCLCLVTDNKVLDPEI